MRSTQGAFAVVDWTIVRAFADRFKVLFDTPRIAACEAPFVQPLWRMNSEVHRLRIAGFGPLRNVTLEPGRVTLLAGAPGAGKSSVLRALRMITHARNGSLQRFIDAEGGASQLLYRGKRATLEVAMELEIRQGDKTNRYASRLASAQQTRLYFVDESIGFQRMRFLKPESRSLGSGQSESLLREAAKGGDVTAKVVNYLLSKIAVFCFRNSEGVSTLRPYAREDDYQYLRTNGSNLAAFLYRLQKGSSEPEREAWERITHWGSRLSPAIADLSVAPTSHAVPSVQLSWLNAQGAEAASPPSPAESLRAIALIAALAQPTEGLPRFICIDDLEDEISLTSAATIVQLARSISSYAQVLFTTQSPTIVEAFKPEEVVLAKHVEDQTELERPSVAELAAWLKQCREAPG